MGGITNKLRNLSKTELDMNYEQGQRSWQGHKVVSLFLENINNLHVVATYFYNWSIPLIYSADLYNLNALFYLLDLQPPPPPPLTQVGSPVCLVPALASSSLTSDSGWNSSVSCPSPLSEFRIFCFSLSHSFSIHSQCLLSASSKVYRNSLGYCSCMYVLHPHGYCIYNNFLEPLPQQNFQYLIKLTVFFLSYTPVDDRTGPWNAARNSVSVLHITWQLYHISCDFYCSPSLSGPSVSFGAIKVFVTSWFLPRYEQHYRSIQHFQKFPFPLFIEWLYYDIFGIIFQFVLFRTNQTFGCWIHEPFHGKTYNLDWRHNLLKWRHKLAEKIPRLQRVNDACVLSQPVICLFLNGFSIRMDQKMEICYFIKK